MDIQHTAAPAAVQPHKADRTEKTKDGQEADASSPYFSKLLQGLSTSDDGLAVGADAVLGTGAQADADIPLLGAVSDMALGALSVESLVGQTQRLDAANADAAMQDGSLLLQRQEAGLATAARSGLGWGAGAQVPSGQQIATVAAGVQTLVPDTAAPTSSLLATAGAVVAEATGVAESVAQAVVDAVSPDANKEGRVALHGAWNFEAPQMAANPALQRLAGQVEQWAAAAAGVQPKANDRTEASKQPASAGEWLSAGQGSGTRLTENAVQEAQQAQNALFEQQTEAPVEDMRFWLQGKLQRAEVVMDKDGQPVRVQVALRGNAAHVTFHADQAQTREMLDASVAQLKEMLQQQGLELAGVSVQAQTQDGAQQQARSQHAPWDSSAPARQAQVALPVDEGTAPRAPAQGLSLYA